MTTELAKSDPTDIVSVLRHAIDKGADVETMERIADLHERIAARESEAQFNRAFAAFKAACPPVTRRSESQFEVTRDGIRRKRCYASLEDIERVIREPLGLHGLAYRWGDARVENGQLTISCIISHSEGHSKSSSAIFPVDSKSGASEQQKYGSVMTYAQRYSLIQALGLTSCDEDMDGAVDGETITDTQAANLGVLLDEVCDTEASRARFYAYLKENFHASALADLAAADFQKVLSALEKKRKAR